LLTNKAWVWSELRDWSTLEMLDLGKYSFNSSCSCQYSPAAPHCFLSLILVLSHCQEMFFLCVYRILRSLYFLLKKIMSSISSGAHLFITLKFSKGQDSIRKFLFIYYQTRSVFLGKARLSGQKMSDSSVDALVHGYSQTRTTQCYAFQNSIMTL